jgi:hypothetical protein
MEDHLVGLQCVHVRVCKPLCMPLCRLCVRVRVCVYMDIRTYVFFCVCLNTVCAYVLLVYVCMYVYVDICIHVH